MILIRHILREHVAPFFYSLVVITGLFLVDFVVQILDSILTKGLPWRVVLELFFLNAAWMLALSIPMSVLVASLMAFGRMSADGEIDAMRSAGLHPAKMLFPGLLAGFGLAVFLVWFNDRVLPEANYRAASLREDISRKRPAVMLQPRTMIQDFDGFRIWIGSSDEKTDSLHDLTIIQLDRAVGNPPTLISALGGTVRMDSAKNAWIFNLRSGETHAPDRDKPANYLSVKFEELDVVVPNVDSKLHRSEKSYRGDRELSIEDMNQQNAESNHRELTLVHDHSKRIFSDAHWIESLLELDSAVKSGKPLPEGGLPPPPSATGGSHVILDSTRIAGRHGIGSVAKKPSEKDRKVVKRADSLADTSKAAMLSKHGPKKGKPKKPSDTGEGIGSMAGTGRFARTDSTAGEDATNALRSLAMARRVEAKGAFEQIVWERNEQNRYRVEIHKKFSIPVACILFVLIGAPLGILARSGGVGTGAAYSMTFFILYWAGLIGGEALADRGKVDGALAMWTPDGIILVVGLVLVSRMGRQSQFFRYQWLVSLLRLVGLRKKEAVA